MRIKNYIYATFIGLVPTTFIICSIGSGIENIIENNELRIPIIILARNPNEDHELEWISDEFISELTIAD